ncbi:hypothetical protein BU25DRAFT_99596 [Macroventuria anomochaeta]|uniref:Uncharacterized protein n=1 Tax=Macroventuria anomochaeta TaxID=301207 RepID=A0ACB6RWQ7_9PLEO|nr:uncharacterized protein BU25DRAFT_99596 [Macroventuria anomochaeta]KAF2626450.1 hypothetical protein BU25DRAFT_99596 [Macroventuria anomochaeta]
MRPFARFLLLRAPALFTKRRCLLPSNQVPISTIHKPTNRTPLEPWLRSYRRPSIVSRCLELHHAGSSPPDVPAHLQPQLLESLPIRLHRRAPTLLENSRRFTASSIRPTPAHSTARPMILQEQLRFRSGYTSCHSFEV